MAHKKTKKVRFKGLLIIILILYIIITIFYYIWRMPIKNINVSGNTYLKDNYIIDYLNINNEPIIRISKNKIIKKLKKLDLVSDVHVKKNILGTLDINIVEDKVLFYNKNTKKIVLSSGREIDGIYKYLGVPTLINFVVEDIYDELIIKLNKVDREVLAIVSEIEYSPSEVNGKVVDDKRFLFRMNDGNIVYINTTNIEKINNYFEIYEGIVSKNGYIRGCLYLDSNSENKHFNKCDEVYTKEIPNEE